ncbi:hypothetical protein [Acinetobacter bereziniae]|uniref:hypothetical protein n=1 Tax=Acinetobacter bereziniae TaxID=106648 RepID=UPI001C06BBC2|nr:hypothetical protein [Acinetobacter bereziniae]
MNDLFDTVIGNQIKTLSFALPEVDGCSSQWDESRQGFIIQIPNGALFYAPQFFPQKISDRSVEYFLENDTYDLMQVDWSAIQTENFKKSNSNIFCGNRIIFIYMEKKFHYLD